MNPLIFLLVIFVIFVLSAIVQYLNIMSGASELKTHSTRYETFLGYGKESVMDSLDDNVLNLFRPTQWKILLLVIAMIIEFLLGQHYISEHGFRLFFSGAEISYSIIFDVVSMVSVIYEIFVLYVLICFVVFLIRYVKR